MAISSSTRKAGPFLGNDATTVFPFAFKVFTAADLRVVRTNALGIESDLVLDTDYTVALNSNQNNDPGGTVTRTTALPTGERLTITSDVEALQPLVLTNNGGFYPSVINDAFDKITIIAQQLIEQVGRSLKLPISSSASPTLPDPVANQLIAWNSGATGFTNFDPTDLATVAAYADAYIDLFTGNGTQTNFTLTHGPAVLANLSVSISGVVQVGGEDFTWVGTTLTFAVAPPTGTRIQVRYTRAIPIIDVAAVELARDLAQGYASDAAGVSGVNVPSYASRASLAGATVAAAIKQIATRGYAAESDGGGATYARTSYATIVSAGYPAASYQRSTDRIMPDGSTDATNGGYWLIVEPVTRPEMFGPMTTTTETTAAMKAAVHFMALTKRPLVLRGSYDVNGEIAPNITMANAAYNLRFEGDVTITYDASAAATEYFLGVFSTAATKNYIGQTGGSLTIVANSKIQRALSLGCASGSSAIAGECHVRGVRVTNVYGPAGSNGVAYAIDISGPFARYSLDDLATDGATRDASLDATGDCKGLRVSQARVAVEVTNSSFLNVQNALQDADGAAIFGPLGGGGVPVGPLARFVNCTFTGNRGRSCKTQTRRTEAINCVFDRGGVGTISGGLEIDAQCGELYVENCRINIDVAVGASYSVFASQLTNPDTARFTTIRDVEVRTTVDFPRFFLTVLGANSPSSTVLIDNVRVLGVDGLVTTALSRSFVEFQADQVKLASTKLSITVANCTVQTNLMLIGYTGHDGTDLSAKLAIHAYNNKNTLTVVSNNRVFNQLSGTTIAKLTDYTFRENENFYTHFVNWDISFATIKPGNDFVVELAGATVTSGPSGLPVTGYARIVTGTGEQTLWNELPREIIVENYGRHFYTQTGTWVELADRAMLEGTATFDAASLALGGSGAIQTLTVTGAALGDLTQASLSVDLAGVVIHSWVSAANTVKYFAHNLGGADPVDLASATAKIRVVK